MPVLKNARHERFAQELAQGKTATDAYEAAGYKADRKNAARLTTNDGIKRRVEELKERVAEKAEWSAADRLASLKTIFDASSTTDPRIAIAAIAEANKMQGSYAPEKREHTGKDGAPIQQVVEHKIDGATVDRAIEKLKSLG